ncbi:non-ribosomal peptide synthetase [Corallococcus terminator]|uniref:L-cysteine--[L-cysteinyl-carrier protein] ligase n=1 Tax=Corallococcus terminator TaxID=2316733 RepID=A0A3A8I1Z9_9BACT|nr:non-ribosomal peptide synthetase [Corallococcus terminator]RKG77509.1 amino acid adenylation domain-containing protein [Corallococcus terminator]
MRRVEELLSELRQKGITLHMEGEKLRCRAPRGALDARMRAAVEEHKEELLAFLRRATPASPLPQLIPALAQRFEPFPLTDVQHAYWLGRSGAFELGQVSTHGYCELESRGLDPVRLEAALRQLIARHDMLRAVILPDGRQRILESPPPYQLAVVDLRGQPGEVIDARLAALRQEMAHQVLPSDRWPLFDIRASLMDGQRLRLHLSLDALIADVWSMGLIFREWAWLYHHPEQPLPPLALSFRDYVLAEQALRETEHHARSKAYWMGRLDTLAPAPELPLSKSPSALEETVFERRAFLLSREDWQALKHQATQAGLTPSVAIFAAFAEVLGTWSKNPRFTLNLTLFNRLPLHSQVDGLVGDFTSLTLLEVDHSRPESFTDRGLRLQEQLWRDLDHRHFSGVRVLRELARREGGGQKALMPVVFTSTLALGAAGQTSPEEDWLGEVLYGIGQTPQVWLDHQLVEQRGGALLFTWDAVEALFPPGLLDDMFGAYEHLVRQLATGHAGWSAERTALLPASQLSERQGANATLHPPSEQLLHGLFEEQARRHPDAPAVITPERTLSHADVARVARQVATSLRERGVGANTLVAVIMDKGWEQVPAVLGILMAGAAYLPIDPRWPATRRAALLEQAGVVLAVTQTALEDTLEWPAGVRRLSFDAQALHAPDPGPLPFVAQDPDGLAYIIYTSGSTGVPKGVMISHRGAVNTLLDINRRFAIGPGDRTLAISALTFDLSVHDVFGMLAAGGAVVIPSTDEARDPASVARLMTEHGVTVWNSVPALMQLLVDYLGAHPGQVPPGLRLCLLSGDWVPLALPPSIRSHWPEARTVSLGGATEASIWSIFHPIGEVAPDWKSIPYGKPLANQHLHVLNPALEPCPVWVPGALYIGGQGLALGYWRDAERTQASFITHPRTGERLYKTGDLGRYLPGGDIEFLGREDFQVKVNGFRIELGEIETALLQHPDVKETVVTAVGELRGPKQLLAYVVPGRSQGSRLLEGEHAEPGEVHARWRALIEAGRAEARRDTQDIEGFTALWGALNGIYLDAVCRALRELGAYATPGERHERSELMARCRLSPRYERWLARALQALTREGHLLQEGERFTNPAPLPVKPREARREELGRHLKASAGFAMGDVEKFLDVAEGLADILTERVHSAQVYAAEETPRVYQKLFPRANATAAQVMRAVVEQLPAERPLRIIEVGGGYGTATVHLLPLLPAERTSYVFTDISQYFLQEARKQFARFPFLAYERLDVEKPPVAQGFEAHAYDVVVAVSVLHGTARIEESLRHLRSLLAPGGVLLIIEETRFFPSFDLGMGLQQGFDRFVDEELRNSHPLLSRELWQRMLAQTGFEESEVLHQPGTLSDYLGFDVILARGPLSTRRGRWDVLREHLAQRLPPYMVPSSFVMLDALPLTANGKVDRRALPLPNATRAARAEGGTSPRNPTEEALARIWAEVLGLERLGVHDDFYEVGGDSLLATQISTRARDHFQVEVPLRTLLELRTVAALAAHLDAANAGHTAAVDDLKARVAAGTLEGAELDALRELLAEVNAAPGDESRHG